MYRTNVATFDVPESWQDQSITAFRLPGPEGGGDASFVVTRDTGRGVKDFDVYIAEQTDLCRRNLPEFQLVKTERLSVHGRLAAWVEFTWSKDGAPLQLRQVYFDCGFFAMICTLTSTPRDLPYFEQPWQALMASMVFDQAEAAPAFQPNGR